MVNMFPLRVMFTLRVAAVATLNVIISLNVKKITLKVNDCIFLH